MLRLHIASPSTSPDKQCASLGYLLRDIKITHRVTT